ncbi:MAG TPA: 5'/3'-nucleotidase SurE, partial [Thermoanaerobaculia bacterium]|nr:5'/3'-nucleotidase SurE [Thermoanaerobaculia bacterium]
RGPSERMLLNVNLPAAPASGVRLTRLARRVYEQVVVERGDPRGRRYFWIGGEPRWEEGPDCDHAAITAGMVSITPLRLDLTDYGALEEQASVIAALSRVLESAG